MHLQHCLLLWFRHASPKAAMVCSLARQVMGEAALDAAASPQRLLPGSHGLQVTMQGPAARQQPSTALPAAAAAARDPVAHRPPSSRRAKAAVRALARRAPSRTALPAAAICSTRSEQGLGAPQQDLASAQGAQADCQEADTAQAAPSAAQQRGHPEPGTQAPAGWQGSGRPVRRALMQDPAFQSDREQAIMTQPRHEAAKLQRSLPKAAAQPDAQPAASQQQERSVEQSPQERPQGAAGPLTAAAADCRPDAVAAGHDGARPVPAVPLRSQVLVTADGMAGRHPGTQVAAALAALQQALTAQDSPVLGAAGSPYARRLQSNQQAQLWAAAAQVLQDYPETEVAHVFTMLLQQQQQGASACMADVRDGEPADLAEAGDHPPSGMAGAGEGALEEAGERSPDSLIGAEQVQRRHCSTDEDWADALEDQQQPGGEAADELSQLEAEVQQLQQQQRGSSSAPHVQLQGAHSSALQIQQQRVCSSTLQDQEQRAYSLQAAAAEIREAYPGTEVAQALSLLEQLLVPDEVDQAASGGLQLLDGTAELGLSAHSALQAALEAPRHEER